MSTRDLESVLFALIQTGLQAVGSRLAPEFDGDAIYLRTVGVVLTDMGRIQCFELTAPDTPIMDFAMNDVQAAATAVVVHVLSGVVARAIEADELGRI